jgi:hypothetical protein
VELYFTAQKSCFVFAEMSCSIRMNSNSFSAGSILCTHSARGQKFYDAVIVLARFDVVGWGNRVAFDTAP